MFKIVVLLLGMFFLPHLALAGKPVQCQDLSSLQKGCTTFTPVKDLLIPGRHSLYVSPVKLNQDSLLDLVVLSDGGSGGSMAYVFFQESPGLYVRKGINFAHTIYVDGSSLTFQSRSGLCRELFSRMELSNDTYETKGSFFWNCVDEAEGDSRYQIEDLSGSWPDAKLKSGYQGSYEETKTLVSGTNLNFVLVDAGFRLAMYE